LTEDLQATRNEAASPGPARAVFVNEYASGGCRRSGYSQVTAEWFPSDAGHGRAPTSPAVLGPYLGGDQRLCHATDAL